MNIRSACVLVTIVLCPTLKTSAAERPNILVILADDLGYSDLGCYGGEIQTPHLDSLAKNGLRFTQFYNTARCWPTRAALLTGYYAQQVRRDAVPGVKSGGRGVRPKWSALLPEQLKPLGYRCYHSGKWHLDGMPIASGFDRSYYLRDQHRFFSPTIHWKDDQKLPPVKLGSGFYGTTAIADHAIEYLSTHQQESPKQPFFHYLAFTAPHFPLHALPEDIAKYKDTYKTGWEKHRQQRWQRMLKMKLTSGELSEVEADVGPPYHFPEALKELGPGEVNRPLPWDELTDKQQEFQAAKMAVHAAMVDRMDQEIGRVIAQLKKMNQFENTVIMFLSDNGGSAEIMVRGDGHDPQAPPGSAMSHLCLGPGWSTTANTPFRRHKTWVHEGGICTPFVIHWPNGIKEEGELRDTPAHVIDLVPTILELCGGKPKTVHNGLPVPTAPGRSLVSQLNPKLTPSEERTLWWLHEGNRALRSGPWKLVAAKDEPWELYHLEKDRTETNNVANEHPDLVQKLSKEWQRRFDEYSELAKDSR